MKSSTKPVHCATIFYGDDGLPHAVDDEIDGNFVEKGAGTAVSGVNPLICTVASLDRMAPLDNMASPGCGACPMVGTLSSR